MVSELERQGINIRGVKMSDRAIQKMLEDRGYSFDGQEDRRGTHDDPRLAPTPEQKNDNQEDLF